MYYQLLIEYPILLIKINDKFSCRIDMLCFYVQICSSYFVENPWGVHFALIKDGIFGLSPIPFLSSLSGPSITVLDDIFSLSSGSPLQT